MRRPFFRGRKPQDRGPRVNQMIRGPQVRVIGSDGQPLGVLAVEEARKIADEEGFDLVEISPNASPPVCKVMDFGKYKYEKQKREQQSRKKQTKIVVKEIKLRPNTNVHDVAVKMKHVRRFLEHKDKAKIIVQFRGREMMYMERGRAMLNKVIQDLADIGQTDMSPKVEGRTLSVVMAPK